MVMKGVAVKAVLFLTLLSMLLTGCNHLASSATNGGESESSESSEQDGQAQDNLDQYIAESYKHGYPVTLAEESVDLNGDGQSDVVRLLAEWYPIFNEQNEPSYSSGAGLHYPVIEFEIDGQKYSHSWDEVSYESSLSVLMDSNGKGIVVVAWDAGGTGAGTYRVYALSFHDGISFLTVPSFDTPYGSMQGFSVTAPYLDNYCIQVSVPETGFDDVLTLPDDTDLSMYDDQGRCTQLERAAQVGGVCFVRSSDYQGQDAVELVQDISGVAAMDNFGYLISTITWDGQDYIVLDQRVS